MGPHAARAGTWYCCLSGLKTDTESDQGAPRVLLVLDSSAAWSRGILRGFVRAAHEQGWTGLLYPAASNLARLATDVPPSPAVIGPTCSGPCPAALRDCISVAINADRC